MPFRTMELPPAHRKSALLTWMNWILACGTAGLWMSQARAEPIPIHLHEALSYGVQNSPSVTQLQSQVREAGHLKQERAGNFFPSLDVDAEVNRQNSGSTHSAAINAEMTQTLWDNGNSVTQYQASQINESIAQEKFLIARENLSKELVDLYFSATLLSATLAIQKEQLESFEYQFGVIDRLFKQGLKTALEQSRIRAQLLRAKAQLIETQRLRIQNENQLCEKIGRKPGEFVPIPLDLDELNRHRLPEGLRVYPESQNHPWFKVETLTRDIQDHQMKLLDRERWPKVNLAWSVSYIQDGLWKSPESTASGWNWSVGLGASWNIWDFGVRKARLMQASEQFFQAQEVIRNSQLSLQQRAGSLNAEAPLIRESRDLEIEVENVEVKNYAYLDSQYREGKIPFLDLVTALRDRSEARIRKIRAKIRELQITIESHSIEGNLYEWIQKLPPST